MTAAAGGIALFGIGAALPASASELVTVQARGYTVEEAREAAYDACLALGHARGGTVQRLSVVNSSVGESVHHIIMACVSDNGQIVHR